LERDFAFKGKEQVRGSLSTPKLGDRRIDFPLRLNNRKKGEEEKASWIAGTFTEKKG